MTYFSEPGIFNVLDPWKAGVANGMMPGNVSAAQAEQNAQILQAAIWAAQQASLSGCTSGGVRLAAIILIPGNNDVPPPVSSGGYDGAEYQLAVTGSLGAGAILINCYWPLLIRGTGNVKLTMVANTLGYFGDMFHVANNTGSDNLGGVTFEDLILSFDTVSSTDFAAIRVIDPGAANVRVTRVVFDDCPQAIFLANSNYTSIFDCYFYYTSNTGTFITIGGTGNGQEIAVETYIGDCVMFSRKGGTGVLIQGSEHVRMVNCRVDQVYQGILIEPNADGANAVIHTFENVTVYPGVAAGSETGIVGPALIIQPQGSGGAIGDITFVACEFEPGDSATGSIGPGVTIDPNNGKIDTVRFVSCKVTRWFASGMEIKGGANIEVIGGLYSGNAQSGGTAAGIAIVGPAVGVRITGVACIGAYTTITNSSSSTTPQQQVGVYIDAAATNIRVVGCDLSGNALYGAYVAGGATYVELLSCNLMNNVTYGAMVTGASGAMTTNVYIRDCNAANYSSYNSAVHVSGTYNTDISEIEVTNCAGYNDTGNSISSALPISTSTFHNHDFGYYGPIAFMLWGTGVTHVHIDGISTTLTSGYFELGPNDRGQIDWSGSPGFVVIGK